MAVATQDRARKQVTDMAGRLLSFDTAGAGRSLVIMGIGVEALISLTLYTGRRCFGFVFLAVLLLVGDSFLIIVFT